MKRMTLVVLVISISILCLGSHAFGQLGLRKGIKIGYNMATLTGDDPFTGNPLSGVESRESFAGGVSIEFNFIGLLSFQIDGLYSPKGCILSDEEEIHLNYISVPMVIKKKFFPVGIHPYILGGLEFNFLLSAKHKNTNKKNHFTSEDLVYVLGGGVEFSFLGKSAYIEGRYSGGLNKINENFPDADTKNRVTQIFFGFLF